MRAKGEAIPMEARLLRIASDFHTHDPKNLKASRDFIVEQEYKIYDPSIARAFLRCIHEDLEVAVSVTVELNKLLPGMVLCQDIQLVNGSIVLPAGVSLTLTMISQLKRLGKLVEDKIRVYAELKGNMANRSDPASAPIGLP